MLGTGALRLLSLRNSSFISPSLSSSARALVVRLKVAAHQAELGTLRWWQRPGPSAFH